MKQCKMQSMCWDESSFVGIMYGTIREKNLQSSRFKIFNKGGVF